MKIITDDNRTLDAEISMQTIENRSGITFHSRSGTNASNIDYIEGVETVLKRLKVRNIKHINVFINSTDAIGLWPVFKERQLIIENNPDIPLDKYDVKELRTRIGAELANRKKDPGSKGGNRTKRFFLTTLPDIHFDWNTVVTPSNEDLLYDIETASGAGTFDLNNIEDATERILTSIVNRKGQSKFRNSLLKLYGNKCAITQCTVGSVLQAAHIMPYMGQETNHLSNGLILRSDIHDLFDLNLISINEAFKVVISIALKGSEYEKYHNTQISLPDNPHFYPSIEALKARLKINRG